MFWTQKRYNVFRRLPVRIDIPPPRPQYTCSQPLRTAPVASAAGASPAPRAQDAEWGSGASRRSERRLPNRHPAPRHQRRPHILRPPHFRTRAWVWSRYRGFAGAPS